MKTPLATGAVPVGLVNGSFSVIAQAVRPRPRSLELHPVKLRVIEQEITGGDAREVGAVFASGEYRAECVAGAVVIAKTRHPVQRGMISFPGVLPIICHEHRRDVGTSEFSGKLDATQWSNDPPGVDQLVGGIEQLQSIEEERALLPIKQCESLVQQHLSYIRFDLREIRIDRAVEGEILSDPPSHIATKVTRPLIVTSIAE